MTKKRAIFNRVLKFFIIALIAMGAVIVANPDAYFHTSHNWNMVLAAGLGAILAGLEKWKNWEDGQEKSQEVKGDKTNE